MQSIEDAVQVISKFKPGAPLLRYIGKIRFPNYKNIEPNAELLFQFPLTVLVGANGSGKSSVLHALYGAPEGYTTRDFWFSTELDPISEGKGLGASRYIYAHWNDAAKTFVETRKSRVKSGPKLDYWEPTKIVASDGMQPLPSTPGPGAASDRWFPVARSVVHINFKAEISAFDRYFYFETGQTKDDKHAAMLREATRLKWVIEKKVDNYWLWHRRRVFENRQLSDEELEWVKFILGHPYVSATVVRHTLYPGYRGQDISVLFEKPSHTYSEAFAGSGEVAIVSSVVKLLAAEDYALVLLDEPETSLHPGAQRRLLNFLLHCIKKKKMQVVMSTHSPEFLRGLPDEAIKVLEETPSGRVTINNSSSPLVAFKRLGASSPGRIRVIVEDATAKQVVDVVRRQYLPDGERDKIEVVVVPGGAESILGHYIPAAIAGDDNTFVLLDGDKTFTTSLPDLATVAPVDELTLGDKIKMSTGVSPSLYLSGGDDPLLAKKKVEEQKKYIGWVQKRVRFLPCVVPEEIVVRVAFPKLVPKLDGTASTAKATLFEELDSNKPDATGDQVATLAGYELSKNADDQAELLQIKETLSEFISIWRGRNGD